MRRTSTLLLIASIIQSAGLIAIALFLASHDPPNLFSHVGGDHVFEFPYLILVPAFNILWLAGPATAFATATSFVCARKTMDGASDRIGSVIAWTTVVPSLVVILAVQSFAGDRLLATA